jgi:hypothetical protein
MLVASALLFTSCAAQVSSSGESNDSSESRVDDATANAASASIGPSDVPSDGAATSSSLVTSDSVSSVPVSTTTTEPASRFYNDDCVIEIEVNDTLVGIVERIDDGETINRVSLRAENGLVDERLTPGDTLDVCPGNGVDDVTGSERVDPSEEIVSAAIITNVQVQQMKLNLLFAELGARELAVDGIAGPVTRQRLCAARLALGLEVSTAEMAAGSEEEQILLAADELPPPPMATVDQDQWLLIDQTCQFIFAGAVDELVFGFPTSTGEPGHETRTSERSRAFRFDPAADTGGWHDSSEFPVSIDNPLNGNMYKPIYFDGGQAIHGANNVPTSPQSKGCARLSVEHQDLLVAWLGLQFDTAPTWSQRAINLTVSVQGAYQG